MNRTALAILLAAALPACKTPASHTDVVAASPGVFTVTHRSVPHFYTMTLLRGQALTGAVAHCKSLGRTMRPVDERPEEPPPGSNEDRRFHLSFACD